MGDLASSSPARPKNWLLLKVRQWHTWLGVALAGVIVLVCVTGIYLNHKDVFGLILPGPSAAREHQPAGMVKASGVVLTAGAAAELPMGFERALQAAAEHLGADAPLEKIELKNEHGRLTYKIKTDKHAGPERELLIDAQAGGISWKNEAGYSGYGKGQRAGTGGYDWNKIIKDLHTGKIGGQAGKLLIDLTSVVILVLTLSGVYLWWVARGRKRRSSGAARAQQAAPASQAPSGFRVAVAHQVSAVHTSPVPPASGAGQSAAAPRP